MFVGGRRISAFLVAPIAAAVLTAGMTGCSGSSDSPTVLPPLSATPEASSSSAPLAQDPKTAAVAVVREYFRLLNAPTTLSTANALAALMTADCSCRKVATSTREVAQRSQHYFGRTTATEVTPTVEDAGRVDVLVNYDYTDTGLAKSDGSVVSRSPGRTGATLDFRLTRTPRGWLIAALVYVREGRAR